MFMDIFQMGCASCTAVYMGLLHVPARTPLVGTYLLRQDIMVINARYIFIGSGGPPCAKAELRSGASHPANSVGHATSVQAFRLYIERCLL